MVNILFQNLLETDDCDEKHSATYIVLNIDRRS